MNFRLGGSKEKGFDQSDDGIVIMKGTMQDFYDIFKKATKIPTYQQLPDDAFSDEELAKFDEYTKRLTGALSDNTIHRKDNKWFEI